MTTTVYIANEADALKGRKLLIRQVDAKGEDWNPPTHVNPNDAIVLHVHAGCQSACLRSPRRVAGGVWGQVSVSARDPYSYESLPESIKAAYSEKEWSWLSPSERVRAVRNETEPDWRE